MTAACCPRCGSPDPRRADTECVIAKHHPEAIVLLHPWHRAARKAAPPRFSLTQVAMRAGVTPPTVLRWLERGLVAATLEDDRRWFTEEQARWVATVADLAESGVSIEAMSRTPDVPSFLRALARSATKAERLLAG